MQDKPQQAWRYYRFWLIAIVVTESVMLIRHRDLFFIYLVIAALFAGGWILRILKLYPGDPEPFILDLSGVFIALGFAWMARWLGGSAWRFLLIFCSSAIVMPHLVYIYFEK